MYRQQKKKESTDSLQTTHTVALEGCGQAPNNMYIGKINSDVSKKLSA